jgi:serine/threonine-protein kinase
VPISGGPALFVTSLGGAAPRGASWSPDGTIVFATDDPATGLWRVSENGGTAQLLTKADQGDHVWPYVLPGGAAILFTQFVYPVRSPEVAVLDPMTGERRALMPGSHALYVPTGHLVYSASGTLRAIGFDLSRRAVVGISRPVLDQVSTLMTAALGVVLASDGTLAYVSGASNAARELVWVDRDGKEEGLGAATAGYVMPRLSPDGRKVVLDERVVSGNGLWMWDIERKMMMPFTFGVDAYPLWTPDGERVVYTSFDPKTGVGNLTWQSASGAGGPERLIEGSRSRYATSFAPDGSRLVFREEADAGLDIGVLSLGATRGAELTIQTEHSELNPEISPDGRWLAYESNQSGSAEIYVRPFPDVDAGLWQVSAGGGVQPAWARNGRELFYRTVDGALMAVPVELKPRFVAGAPAKIFEGRYFSGGPYRAYDVSPDGKRFLVITRGAATGNTASAPGIVVVQNWTEELKRLVLTK